MDCAREWQSKSKRSHYQGAFKNIQISSADEFRERDGRSDCGDLGRGTGGPSLVCTGKSFVLSRFFLATLPSLLYLTVLRDYRN